MTQRLASFGSLGFILSRRRKLFVQQCNLIGRQLGGGFIFNRNSLRREKIHNRVGPDVQVRGRLFQSFACCFRHSLVACDTRSLLQKYDLIIAKRRKTCQYGQAFRR
ncbi:hypothetical protein [Hymenobacter latericus]|uniref:hypothetical protein n=1 Tax=Hymenobacter sp. YIM 151858-1 TaxID=2987688 RepID=UPI0022268F76|nr:hypothetical protein [Hymenobacter sp. YIM 151858-1]UYZ57787.1 hypothetical protein OIS50_12005 [Hymenobacter sp. YIM 151858-1]